MNLKERKNCQYCGMAESLNSLHYRTVISNPPAKYSEFLCGSSSAHQSMGCQEITRLQKLVQEKGLKS